MSAIPEQRTGGRYLVAAPVAGTDGKDHAQAWLLDSDGNYIEGFDLDVAGHPVEAVLGVAGNESNSEFLVTWVEKAGPHGDVPRVVGRTINYLGGFASEIPSQIEDSAGLPAVTAGLGKDFLVVFEKYLGDDVTIYGRFWGEGGDWKVYFPLLLR